jgi:Sulfotransferase domain
LARLGGNDAPSGLRSKRITRNTCLQMTDAKALLIAGQHPQVLHIGFSKCASSFLRAVFRAQPRIHLVFKSGFFTPLISGDMTFAQYQALFRDESGILNVESDEHLTLPGVHPELGVRSTTLHEFETVVDKIKQYIPDVRIMMVIRNQASLIVSRYSEYLIGGGSLEFKDFACRLLDDGHGKNLYYQNYYSRLVSMLRQRFPEAQLLILLQEAMREDSVRSLAMISEFLGLNGLEDMKKGLQSERRSLSLAGMWVLRIINQLIVKRSSVGSAPPTVRVPQPIYRFIVNVVRAIDFYLLAHVSPEPSVLLTESHRRAVLAHFRDDNIRLQETLRVDLRALGYLDDSYAAR